MKEAAAISSLGVMLALVLTRPTIRRVRIGAAHAAAAGVLLMLLTGLVHVTDIAEAGRLLWRPLLTVTAIMVMAAAAHRLGLLAGMAEFVVPRAGRSTTRLFTLVFALSAATSAVLNNDAAVLMLTPLVVLLIRRRYPDRPSTVVPFAFAVFMAAGVAPFVVSNPMNIILADFAGIGFNPYAARMVPISLAGWVVSFVVLWAIFRNELVQADPFAVEVERDVASVGGTRRRLLIVLLAVLGAYPVMAYFDGPIWVVSVAGAVVAIWMCVRARMGPATEIVVKEVSWETLIFFVGALVVAVGLRNAGIVDRLASVYDGAAIWTVGVVSALGSALINNHPMALTNLLALGEVRAVGQEHYLAALIGGDLGPRLLPNGSLAGLLWFAALRRLDQDVSILRFVVVGTAVTVPSLGVSLALLHYL